jgi:hypothetical protein
MAELPVFFRKKAKYSQPVEGAARVLLVTRSVVEAATQRFDAQMPLAQSPATAHPQPLAHLYVGAQAPPQSLSVSVPFLTVSVQLGAWHKLVLLAQSELWQSPLTKHVALSGHLRAGAQMPPQSTSVSAWFCTLSVQVAAWHTSLVQTPLTQSVGLEQTSPAGHLLQVLAPPQSVPLSVPFLALSLQVGIWHT